MFTWPDEGTIKADGIRDELTPPNRYCAHCPRRECEHKTSELQQCMFGIPTASGAWAVNHTTGCKLEHSTQGGIDGML